MGMVLGKIGVETPKYKVMASTSDYQVRKYPPSVVAEITYRPSDFKSDKDGGFTILAKYIGAFGNPQNKRPEEPIAMTAPVITKTASSETIAMTVPVVTKSGGNDEEVTMGFILPSKYSKTEDAPRPVDERVVIREEGEKKYGVVKFSGVARENVVEKKVEELRKCLERDGYKAAGDFVLASATNLRPIVATLSRSREKRGWCRCYADQAPLPTKRGHRQLLDPPPPTLDPSPAAAAHANGAAFRFNVGGR